MCGSCPRGDADVSTINKVINNLAQEFQLRYIDTYTPFYDKNEDLRTKFYGKRDWIHLFNSGIKRLLGIIHNVTAIVVYSQLNQTGNAVVRTMAEGH